MAEAALDNVVEWSVSELSAALKRTVEDAYGYVRVRGEISGFKGASPSGHCYFRLKDDKAVLEAVIWKGTHGRMRVKPEEGLDVIVTGRLTTFAGSSKYQIVIDTLEPAGVGARDADQHRLAARMNVDVLNRYLLLAFAAMAVEGFEQRRIGARQLVGLGEVLASSLEGLFADHGAPVAFH